MSTLEALRESGERLRLERMHRDDATTSFSREIVKELEAQLRQRIRGEVRFDNGSRALYATDGSNYRQTPIGLVIPQDKDDVEATVAVCRLFDAPILSRGCGTSLAGQCCNVAVVMDFSKYLHHVLKIDAERKLGTVEPGCVLDSFREEAARQELMFAPDPATHSHCTLGGMLGNNSCGIHSLLAAKYGRGLRTADNTHELEILTYDGTRMRVGATPLEEFERIRRAGGRQAEIYARLREFVDKYADDIRQGFPKLPRRVSGYNLDALLPENNFHVAQALVGSESTLVTILEATLDLVPNPKARSLLILGYPDVFTAGDHVTEILPLKPTGLEGFDHRLFQWVQIKGRNAHELKLLPEGGGHLMVEFGGESKEDADEQARRCMEMLKKAGNPPTMKLFDDPEEEEKVWKVRESGLSATAWVPGQPDGWPGWEDSAVPPEKVGEYLRKLRNLFDRYDYHPSIYGHLGQGCIHCRVGFDLYTAEGVSKFRQFMEEAADLVVSLGGSLSGEHGDGQARGELLPKMYGEKLMQAFREFKSIWDPQWKMNPGKKINAAPLDAHLRLGPDYNPPQPATHFQFPNDRHSFSRAALRCVGVGNCRREGGGVMCPSYMATREEMHSTRGRAHLLFEMLNGDVLTDGWRSDAVKESLDLCLACKGCKGDCPVNVDMATYKAEFLSHYYQGRLRPRYAYSMGLIDWWAWLASYMPGIANVLTQTPGLSFLTKWFGGIAPKRKMPPFARESFQAWFRRRPEHNLDKPPVLLFPDTFNNYFHPEILKAAVEVLEAADFRVLVPQEAICSGRPLYDFGMLKLAKRVLRQVLRVLQPYLEAGICVVGLEPSSVAVFRDEMAELFPNDKDVDRMKKQTFLLSEFLRKKAPDFRVPKLQRKALVWGHCHHRSVLGFEDEFDLLKEMGLDLELVSEGTCCGMAGSFGFETDHYEISQQIGEMSVLPKVRQADSQTIIIADGFSCQEQIRQGHTRREALHFSQVLQMALREGPGGPSQNLLPETKFPKILPDDIPPSKSALATAALIGVGLIVGGYLVWRRGRK